ncbi:161aa long hypothetical protein [Pyrococcus horikoshii OT3]|uniref:Uncharacterized protein n=1 Tax=Pyrococcus horikoshii (strain ATCC 700860 / DSM 12428 / JCM 9974 / NBRC 100139 / OT-3) TaxID=70601 RepID=O58599_PYRHO|nr:161aa long hypothetical protein [Pyrococcus horikoshii OT3]
MKSPNISPITAIIFLHEGLVIAKKALRVILATVPKTAYSVNLATSINIKKEQGTKQASLKHPFQTHLLNIQSQPPPSLQDLQIYLPSLSPLIYVVNNFSSQPSSSSSFFLYYLGLRVTTFRQSPNVGGSGRAITPLATDSGNGSKLGIHLISPHYNTSYLP